VFSRCQVPMIAEVSFAAGVGLAGMSRLGGGGEAGDEPHAMAIEATASDPIMSTARRSIGGR
jgi:hypothetical protein